MNDAVRDIIRRLQAGEPVSGRLADGVFTAIMAGEATPAQIGATLLGLSIRGETPEIVAAAARAMRQAAVRIRPRTRGLIDTCGTGGDGASTFNISTAVSFVVAAAGQPVAKHGNRAMSSRSGAADVLEALGVNLNLAPEDVADCIDEVGIGFLFAQALHPAMRHAGPVRRELGVRTIFNILGPLTNPAGAEYQIMGVFARDRLELAARALAELGATRALVVHGRDGLDEITTTDVTDAMLVEAGRDPQPFEIDPAAFGIPRARACMLKGGDAAENAAILREILGGALNPGRDIVLLNAAAALWVAGAAEGIPEGLRLAAEAIDSGRAMKKLDELVAFTQSR